MADLCSTSFGSVEIKYVLYENIESEQFSLTSVSLLSDQLAQGTFVLVRAIAFRKLSPALEPLTEYYPLNILSIL